MLLGDPHIDDLWVSTRLWHSSRYY